MLCSALARKSDVRVEERELLIGTDASSRNFDLDVVNGLQRCCGEIVVGGAASHDDARPYFEV